MKTSLKHVTLDPTPFTPDTALKSFPNRYILTLAAAARARQIAGGSPTEIESKNKECVTALREIAEGKIGDQILEQIVESRVFQRRK